MLGKVVRRVVLRYVRSLVNLEVEKLELWSGAVALESVSLNPTEATKVLNLPGVRLLSGSISRLELSIPWTNLLEEAVHVHLRGLNIHLLIPASPAPSQDSPQPSEDSLLQTVLSNLQISVEDLTITVEFEAKSRYFARAGIGTIEIVPVNSAGEVGFQEPVSDTGVQVIRKVTMEKVHFRVVSGPAEAYLSHTVLGHLGEKKDCGTCGLCQAFQLSGFYTLLRVKQWSADVVLGYERKDAQESSWVEVKTDFPLHIRSNLIAQTDLSADIVRLYNCLYTSQEPSHSLFLASMTFPQFTLVIKTYNPTTLQLGSLDLHCELLTMRLLGGSEASAEGSVQSLALAIRPHNVRFELESLRYGLTIMTKLVFSSAGLRVLLGTETLISAPNTIGKLLFEPEVRLQSSLRGLDTDLGLSAMMAVLAGLNDLRLFYLRWWGENSLLPHTDSLLTSPQRDQSWTLDSLREELVAVSYRALAATAETERLRSVLARVCPLSSLPDLLSLENDSILAVSPDALYAGLPCKAMLTASQLLLISPQGHILLQVPSANITSAQAINTQDLLLHIPPATDLTLSLTCRDQFLACLHTIS